MKNYNKYYNQPLYAVFRRTEEGVLLGWVEHSFSMDWSPDKVRVWTREYSANCFTNQKALDEWIGMKGCFVARVRSKNCPANIVLDTLTEETKKFERRNKKFTEKA